MSEGEINEIIKKLLSNPQLYAVFKEQIMADPKNMEKVVSNAYLAIQKGLEPHITSPESQPCRSQVSAKQFHDKKRYLRHE